MSDPTSDNAVDPVALVRSFLNSPNSRERIEVDGVGSLVPFVGTAVCEIADRDPNALPKVLLRLAGHVEAKQLLEAVLAAGGARIARGLGGVGIAKPRHEASVAKTVNYLVLRTASQHERFIEHWITYDPAMFAYKLTSAELAVAEAGPLADLLARALRARTDGPARRESLEWWHHDWDACDECSAAADDAIAAVDIGQVLHLARQVHPTTSVLRLVRAIGEIDQGVGRRVAERPEVLDALSRALGKRPTDDEWISHSFRVEGADILALAPFDFVDAHASESGQAVAGEITRMDLPRSPESVAALLGRDPSEVGTSPVVAIALIWAHARRLAIYHKVGRWDSRDEMLGVAAQFVECLELPPDAWVASVSSLLERWPILPEHVKDTVALAAVQHGPVADELRRLGEHAPTGELRDRALGVLSLVSGAPTPGDELRRWLGDSAARVFDGTPLFPHPLTALARTWLGSIDVEQTLAASIRRALLHFAEDVKHQGAAEEEGLTKAIVKELEFAFRDTSLSLQSAGRRRLARAVTLDQRPVAKREEASWGCDLALLLDVSVAGALQLHTVELVQVKKSQLLVRRKRKSPAPTESWSIDVAQLTTLLDLSESATYWLIVSSGEVLSIPARLVYGLAQGRGALTQSSFTVGYNDVRHGAIPLEQFLPELVIGLWIGSTDPAALEFARGENAALVPRHIIEISIQPSRE